MWLLTPLLEKNVAPKFLKPYTEPLKVKKQFLDVTYEICHIMNTIRKFCILTFKRAIVKFHLHKLSHSKLELSLSSVNTTMIF